MVSALLEGRSCEGGLKSFYMMDTFLVQSRTSVLLSNKLISAQELRGNAEIGKRVPDK